MSRIFEDSDMERAFRRKGYVVVPFLEPDEIHRLEELHDTLTPTLSAEAYASVFSRNALYRRSVSEGIGSTLREKIAKLLAGYPFCFAMFVAKRPASKGGRFPLHQDYSFVDQGIHTAVHFWIPLSDVDERNGCLHVVEGSHRIISFPYAVNHNPSPINPVREQLHREFTKTVPMSAGSAFVYDSRLLHGSEENSSDRVRVACVAFALPEGVKPRVYVWNEREPSRFDALEVSQDFLLEFECGKAIEKPYPPGVRYLESVHCRAPALGPEDLVELRRVQSSSDAS